MRKTMLFTHAVICCVLCTASGDQDEFRSLLVYKISFRVITAGAVAG